MRLPLATAFATALLQPRYSRTTAIHCVFVVFEDDSYFFVRKPPGLSVAGDVESEQSFHEQVKDYSIERYGHQPNLLHRLDKGTSGLMVYAKSREAAKHYLKLQDTKGAITKDYVAVVCGAPPAAAGRVAGGIAKSRDCRSFVVRGRGSGKAVLTTYKVLGSKEHPQLGPL